MRCASGADKNQMNAPIGEHHHCCLRKVMRVVHLVARALDTREDDDGRERPCERRSRWIHSELRLRRHIHDDVSSRQRKVLHKSGTIPLIEGLTLLWKCIV